MVNDVCTRSVEVLSYLFDELGTFFSTVAIKDLVQFSNKFRALEARDNDIRHGV